MTFITGIRVLNSTPGEIYTSHQMATFSGLSGTPVSSVQKMKDAGHNNIWVYLDLFQGNEVQKVMGLLDAAQTVGGITVAVGVQGGNAGQRDIDMMLAVKDHPALYRIGGKPAYMYYSWNKALYTNTLALLAANGINRSDYILLVNTLYATELNYPVAMSTGADMLTSFRGGSITSPHTEPNNYVYYYYQDAIVVMNYSGSPHFNDKGIPFMFDTYGVDGFVNFGVNKSKQESLNENAWMAAAAKAKGKVYVAGIGGAYDSVSFEDYGFDGIAELWQAIIDLPAADRPRGVSDTTANDYAELSYREAPEGTITNGMFHISAGNNVRYWLTDHSGLQKFTQPWYTAYLSGAASPTYTTDRIFCWYYLHPVNASLVPTLPAELNGIVTQSEWNGMVYATGSIQVGGGNQIDGIKSQLNAQIGKIRMAAHLTAPGYLKINNTLSDTSFPAGPAFFEIDMGSFRDAPVFSIINTDGTTVRKTGTGQQAITSSCYPGGWNPMITEV